MFLDNIPLLYEASDFLCCSQLKITLPTLDCIFVFSKLCVAHDNLAVWQLID